MIRNATIEDAGRISEIYVFGWRSAFHDFLPETFLYAKLSVEKRTRTYEKLLAAGSHDILVHEENGIVKGFLHAGKCENADKKNAYALYDLFVEPSMTGQGIGGKLIGRSEELSLQKGYDESVLWTFEKNVRAIRLYENLGYGRDGMEELDEAVKTKSLRFVKRIERTG